MSAGTTVVRAVELGRRFDTATESIWAVRDVEVEIHRGEFVAVMGPSGCGKTTLLNLIAGLDWATSGSVEVLSHDMGLLDEGRRADLRLTSIGMVFQDDRMIAELDAAENVALPMEVRGMSRRASAAVAASALERVGLPGLGRSRPSELSGGQRQRVGLARAIAGERPLLLADEPTGSLDRVSTEHVVDLIKSLCAGGLTAMVATHDPIVAAQADRVVSMADGAITGDVSVGP